MRVQIHKPTQLSSCLRRQWSCAAVEIRWRMGPGVSGNRGSPQLASSAAIFNLHPLSAKGPPEDINLHAVVFIGSRSFVNTSVFSVTGCTYNSSEVVTILPEIKTADLRFHDFNRGCIACRSTAKQLRRRVVPCVARDVSRFGASAHALILNF